MNNQKIFFNKNEIDDVACYDRSLVEERNEKLSITILKILGNSFINNIVNSSDRLILTINLILLGHIPQQNKTHYELFMTYEIGVALVDFFGKLIIIGLLKYLFERKESAPFIFLTLEFKFFIVLL